MHTALQLESKSAHVRNKAGQDPMAGKSFPSRTLVHAKLETTSPQDEEEKEADAMADDIVHTGMVHRQVSTGVSASSGVAVSSGMEGQLSRLQGVGRQMPSRLQHMMETGFGRDFSQVRLHTDSEAEAMSASIHAKAFTYGNDIYFNKGQFAPESADGQHLIAHELAHVVQDGGRVARETFDLSSLTEEQRRERRRRNEVMANLNYCRLRIDGLIDAVHDQEENDNSFWGWSARLFSGNKKEDLEYMLDTLREAKTHVKELINSKNDIEEIDRGGQQVLKVVRTVEGALAAYRNNNIEGAGDCIAALKVTKTVCFATAGAIAATVAAPAAFGTMLAVNMGIGAASGAVDNIANEVGMAIAGESQGFGQAAFNVFTGTVIGAASGLAGGTAGNAISGAIVKDTAVGLVTGELVDEGFRQVTGSGGSATGDLIGYLSEEEEDTEHYRVSMLLSMLDSYGIRFDEGQNEYVKTGQGTVTKDKQESALEILNNYKDETKKKYDKLYSKRRYLRIGYNKGKNEFYPGQYWVKGSENAGHQLSYSKSLTRIVKKFPSFAPKSSLKPDD